MQNYSFLPFSDDIVFFDAEFTGLNIHEDDLISVGMISFDGKKELYFELPYDEAKLSDWTREHIVPFLTGEVITHEEARSAIRKFCGKSEPHLVATANRRDMGFFTKLFENKTEPIHRIPIDFASVLFAIGLNPARTIHDQKELFYESFDINLEDYDMHNALDDARLMRDLYIKLAQPSVY
jgi:DNA polymerase III epsilon subunit-like protein